MKEKLIERLAVLKKDFDDGQKQLTNKNQEMINLQSTLLRIQGAITVIEEILNAKPE